MSSIQPWQSVIETIKNGEPITAEVANRAIAQLAYRTEHLKDRQDAQSLAAAIFISGAPFTDDVKTGHVVYFNTVAGKFAPAYADMEYKDGYLQASESSTVAGIVVYKETTNSGVIVVEGLINPALYIAIDCTGESIISNILLNPEDRGVLYLTSGSANAGTLTPKPGLLNIPICTLLDDTHLLVRPPITSPLDTQAFRFELTARPATPELILLRVSGSAAENFPSGASTALTVNTTVQVYDHAYATPDTVSNIYLTGKVHSLTANELRLVDVVLTKHGIQQLNENNADYALVFKAVAGAGLAVKVPNTVTGYRISYGADSTSGAGITSYISPIDDTSTAAGYVIKGQYVDPTLPGWMPATTQYFPYAVIPPTAKYGYNFAADKILHQLFPETVVGAYVVSKNGVALPDSVVQTGSNGIWWSDPFLTVPWNKVNDKHVLPDTNIKFSDWSLSDAAQIVPPTDLTLVYTKLVSGGIKVVTSLETPADSPITITDPDGRPANSGPLIIKAGFTVTDVSTTETGSLVVKDVTNFAMKRGRVVEKIIAGTNITLNSTFAGGQGEVTVGVVGLDGKLEGQPDILTIDDVLIEKDSTTNIFYSSMPPAKNSSILGKVDIPAYLEGTYKLNLVITFLALHASGASNMPNLELSWINMKSPPNNEKYNLTNSTHVTSGSISGGLSILASTASPKDYFIKTIELDTAYGGGEIFFRLARSSSDTYLGKLGIVSLRYKFIKST
jgi:hypothetical protein